MALENQCFELAQYHACHLMQSFDIQTHMISCIDSLLIAQKISLNPPVESFYFFPTYDKFELSKTGFLKSCAYLLMLLSDDINNIFMNPHRLHADSKSNQFRKPSKRIGSREDLDAFLASSCCQLFISFIERLNSSVIGVPISSDRLVSRTPSKVIMLILSLLDTLLKWIDDIPAQDNNQSRFGNPAFRLFYDRLASNQSSLLAPIVQPPEAIVEIGVYLQESFGNRQRIDYGTGHEVNFLSFLLCLDQIGVITSDDDTDLVLCVFARYMDVMRQLQLKYWLEPAGSHGVWGLDDYHFLPFLFGSAQLIGHRFCRPRAIRSSEVVTQLAPQYLYFACIQFINSVKTVASLRWHSPMLDDISAIKTWEKVNSGMIKMYRGEVLSKLPIMQHFMFGSLIAFNGGTERSDDAHCCLENEFPTCCGIPVPSAIAASSNIRLLPFD